MEKESNKKIGTKFEVEFAEELRKKGFWVHLLQQSSYGQPADVIAVKDNKAFLIDCKKCSNDNFPLSRIEDNQELAMKKWLNTGNSTPWFAFQLKDDSVRIISFNALCYLRDCLNVNRLNKTELVTLGCTFGEWLNVINSK